MATLTPTLTLESTGGSSGVSENASLSLSVTDTLTVTDPMVGISRIACTTNGTDTEILSSVDITRYVYIKNTGLAATDTATTATIRVEISDNTRIVELGADEFCFFPHKTESSGGLRLEASADTVIAEYGDWTKV